MILSLSSHDYNQMLIWARQAHPQECCGLIWGKKDGALHTTHIELTKNTADKPLKYFEIDPKALFDANRKSRTSDDQIIGFFHSHPNGLASPSQNDANNVIEFGQIWIIIANDGLQGWVSAIDGEIHGRFNAIVINIIN